MKKLNVLALLVAMMLAFTACTKPAPEPSGTPEPTSVIESTPESTVPTPPVGGDTYTAYGMQFILQEGWEASVDGVYTYVTLGASNNAFIMFMEPTAVGGLKLDKAAVNEVVGAVAEGMGGSGIVGTVTEVTIGGRSMWTVQVDVTTNGAVSARLMFWLYQEGNNGNVYIMTFAAQPSYYDDYLPHANALIESIQFV